MRLLLAAIVTRLAALMDGFVRSATLTVVSAGAFLVFPTLAVWFSGIAIRAMHEVPG